MNKILLLVSVIVYATSVSYAQINPTPAQSTCFEIKNGMYLRDTDAKTNGEVTKLQNFLREQGYLKVSATGFYGNVTVHAVRQFQAANGIGQSGATGPKTRETIKLVSASCEIIQNDSSKPVVLDLFGIEVKRKGVENNELYAVVNDVIRGEVHTALGKNLEASGQDIYMIIGNRKIKTTLVHLQDGYFTLEFTAPENLPSGNNIAYLASDIFKSNSKKIYLTKDTGANIRVKNTRPILEYVETQMTNGEKQINTIYRGGKAYLRGFHFYSYGPIERIFVGGKDVKRGMMNPSEIEFTVPLDAPLGKQKITISGAITPIIVNVISQDTQNKWLRIITPNGNEKFGQTQPILVEYESYGIEGEPLGILLEDSRGFTAQPPRGISDLTALKKETLTLFAEYGATPVERYKVKLCAYRVYVNGSPLCDMSDNLFEITADAPSI